MEKRIYDDPEIKKQVYEAYPVTKKEKRCWVERSKREYLRAEMAKQLYDERGNHIEVCTDEPEI